MRDKHKGEVAGEPAKRREFVYMDSEWLARRKGRGQQRWLEVRPGGFVGAAGEPEEEGQEMATQKLADVAGLFSWLRRRV